MLLAKAALKSITVLQGAYVKDFASTGLLDAKGLSFAPDGSLFVTSNFIPGTEVEVAEPDIVSWRTGVLQYDGTTGELIGNIPTGSSGMNLASPGGPQPFDVAVGGANNNVFISQTQARFNVGGIGQYDLTTKQSVGGFGSDSSFFNPQGLALDDNYLYYTTGTSGGRVDLATGDNDTTFLDNSGELSESIDVAIGANGNLFVSNSGTNSIKQYDGQTGNFLGDLVASGSGGLSNPTFVTTANVPVPEPSSVLGVLAFGGLFAGGASRRKRVAKVQK